MKKLMVAALSAAVMSMAAVGAAAASDFPDKPIKVIMPFPAGGTTDQVARIVASKMGDILGQSMVVENRPGAGTVIGTGAVASSPADGYTLLWTATPLAINVSLLNDLPFDTERDLTMVGTVAAIPLTFIVPAASPYKTLAEFVQAAKEKPNALNYGSSGVGGSAHLASAMLFHEAGIQLTHAPYKGSAPAMTDLVGGHLDGIFDTVFLAAPYVESGKIRALGQAGPSRSALMPDVPTFVEQGYPNIVVESWHMVAVPSATPREVIDKLNGALVEALNSDDVEAVLVKQGADPRPSSVNDANAYFKSEVARWGQAVEWSGARKE